MMWQQYGRQQWQYGTKKVAEGIIRHGTPVQHQEKKNVINDDDYNNDYSIFDSCDNLIMQPKGCWTCNTPAYHHLPPAMIDMTVVKVKMVPAWTEQAGMNEDWTGRDEYTGAEYKQSGRSW